MANRSVNAEMPLSLDGTLVGGRPNRTVKSTARESPAKVAGPVRSNTPLLASVPPKPIAKPSHRPG
jgi:hypothetical protein